MEKSNSKSIILKVLYIYIVIFLFFMLVLSQNRWAGGCVLNILTTIAFCFVGGLIPFSITNSYKTSYKYTLIAISAVGLILSVALGFVFYTYVNALTSLIKVLLFLSSFLAVNYLVCDYDNKSFNVFKFDIDISYFKLVVIIASAFLAILFIFDAYILSVSWYGVIIGSGFLLAMALYMGLSKHRDIKSDTVFDLILWIFPLSIIGARTYYILFTLDKFNWTFIEIISVWNGGLAIYGGIIGGAIGLIICCLIKKINILKVMDLAAPCLILGQAIGRWGNFVNQEAYGTLVSNEGLCWFPFAVFIESKSGWYLATFFYESVLSLIGCFVLIYIVRKFKFTGISVASYFIWYGLERVLIEGLRTDSLYIGSTNIRVSQLLSGILVLVGIVWLAIIIIKNYGKNKKVNEKDNKI